MSYHNEYQRTGIAAVRARGDRSWQCPSCDRRSSIVVEGGAAEKEDAPEALVPIVAALLSGIEASPLVFLGAPGVYCRRHWKWRPSQLLEVLGKPLSALAWR